MHVDSVYTELAGDGSGVLWTRTAEGREDVLREFEAAHLRESPRFIRQIAEIHKIKSPRLMR